MRGFDLRVEAGTICGLLGPNGAGKTTVIRILTTLLRPDAGSARVAGSTSCTDAAKVRFAIGLAGQQAAVDELLTGRANLEMVGRLYHLAPAVARRRAGELIERFDLEDAADRPAQDLLGRHAAPPRPGSEPGRDAARPVPGRADDRPRPAQPERDVDA